MRTVLDANPGLLRGFFILNLRLHFYNCYSDKPLTVAGDEFLNNYYSTALQTLGIERVEVQNSLKATIKGHCK